MNKTLHTTITLSFALLILAALFFSVTACDLFAPKYDYTFVNESSYELTITPDGQSSWTAFTLISQTTQTVTIPETTILFTFDNTARVESDTSIQRTIRFTDIPLNNFNFNNYSVHTLTITPDSQTSWEAFSVAAGGNMVIGIPEPNIQFTYDNAGYVNCDTSVSGIIDFRNKTMLTIKNMTSSAVIDFVRWNGVYFGKDIVWDAVLGQYVYGMIAGGSNIKEVSPGSDYVYFWFAAGGPEYQTVALLSVAAEEQKEFTFVDSTTVMPRSLTGTVFNLEEAVPVAGSVREME